MDSATEVFHDPRKRAYLNPDGADKPLISTIGDDVLDRARRYRLQRIRDQITQHGYAGMLLYDPVNIRYALDSSNMAIWTMHDPVRYALIVADGPVIMFESDGALHVSEGLPTVDEVRLATTWMFLTAGNAAKRNVEAWAVEIREALGTGRCTIAVDRLEHPGVHALANLGVDVVDAGPLNERARAIKSEDELELMRWTIRVCEAGMARVYEMSEPGRTEQEIWAELHHENARSGGEYIETKLLTAGPNTNPWFKECSSRRVQRGEIIAFDTDMVGPYGYLADLSRSWTCGHVAMTPKQRELYAAAREQIEHNMALLRPGLEFTEFNAKSWQIPEKYLPYRYTCAVHGSGMADEWPFIGLHPDFDPSYGGCFAEKMVINVESLIAEKGSESIKLETQVLLTATGAERMDTFPWED